MFFVFSAPPPISAFATTTTFSSLEAIHPKSPKFRRYLQLKESSGGWRKTSFGSFSTRLACSTFVPLISVLLTFLILHWTKTQVCWPIESYLFLKALSLLYFIEETECFIFCKSPLDEGDLTVLHCVNQMTAKNKGMNVHILYTNKSGLEFAACKLLVNKCIHDWCKFQCF